MERRRILITNDDGISSPGLFKLARAASVFGDVTVVAPDGERSGISHCFTYKKPVKGRKVDDYGLPGVEAYALDGMPADCVRIGVLKIMDRKPDFVFAGINAGYNIASDIQYSGTIGAVMEAAFQGIAATAFWKGGKKSDELIDRYLEELIEAQLNIPYVKGCARNINFPDCSLEECRGILRDVKVSDDDFYRDEYSLEEDGEGGLSFMVSQKRNWKGTEGTDLYAIQNDYISEGPVYNIR